MHRSDKQKPTIVLTNNNSPFAGFASGIPVEVFALEHSVELNVVGSVHDARKEEALMQIGRDVVLLHDPKKTKTRKRPRK